MAATKLPEALHYGMMVCYKDIAEDATAGLPIFTEPMPWQIEILFVIAVCKATVGGGTARVYTSAGIAISNAVAMANEDVIAIATTVDQTYSTITKGDQIYVRTNGATDRGVICIVFRIVGE